MDKAGASFKNSVASIHTKLKGDAHAIQLNIGEESNFEGIIDLVEMKAYTFDGDKNEEAKEIEIPSNLLEEAKEKRAKLCEAVSNYDEDLITLIIEEKEISSEFLKKAIRKATITGQFFPAVCGSAFKNKGVKLMIDAVVDYLPSPLDIPPVKAYLDGNESDPVYAKDDADFTALAFKIMSDPFVGSLTFCRIYSGVLKKGSYVFNTTKNEKERIGRILLMHANNREEVDEARAGDIVAVVGLKKTTTGDTLVGEKAKQIVLERMIFPEPVISQALEPATKVAMEKLSIGLQKLATEDPTFRTFTDHETGQTIISGMGELHLDIIVDRLKREFGVEANVGAPQVSYRETITKIAEVEGKHIKQTGGRGQYGHV